MFQTLSIVPLVLNPNNLSSLETTKLFMFKYASASRFADEDIWSPTSDCHQSWLPKHSLAAGSDVVQTQRPLVVVWVGHKFLTNFPVWYKSVYYKQLPHCLLTTLLMKPPGWLISKLQYARHLSGSSSVSLWCISIWYGWHVGHTLIFWWMSSLKLVLLDFV